MDFTFLTISIPFRTRHLQDVNSTLRAERKSTLGEHHVRNALRRGRVFTSSALRRYRAPATPLSSSLNPLMTGTRTKP